MKTAAIPAGLENARVMTGLAVGGRSAPFSIDERVDISRGLFAALVVVDHALQIALASHPEMAREMPWLVRESLNAFFNTGTIFVMGFFVISGYCIQLSVSRLMTEECFPLRSYLLARATRILPLYYAGLAFAVIVEWQIADVRPAFWPHGISVPTFLAQLLVVQNLSQTFGSYAPTWSITNEAFYYAFYGLLAAISLPRNWRPAWVGMAVCAAVTLAMQALYVGVSRNVYVHGIGQLFGLGIIWFFGVFVAVHGAEVLRSPAVRVAARWWPAVFLAAAVWHALHLSPHGDYLLPGIAFALMLMRFVDRERTRPTGPSVETPSALRTTLVNVFGLASYPMYLFHGPLMLWIGSAVIRWHLISDWRLTWAFLVTVGISVGLALGVYAERPLMAWRAGWLKDVQRAERVRSTVRPSALSAGHS